MAEPTREPVPPPTIAPQTVDVMPPPVPQQPIKLQAANVGDVRAATIYQWRCSKGHLAPIIGMVFSAYQVSNDPEHVRGPLRDRRYCAICLFEALDKLGVSEVERVD